MLQAALDYAARGWPVFPLRPAAKVPATKRGLHAATTDPDTLTAWWTHNPAMNIGIATGPAGLLVVDVDYKPDAGIDGLSEWWDLTAVHGFTPTYCVATPSGGLHFYCGLEPGWCIRNSASKLAPGVDVRADGGYVVAPPSVTAAGVYEADHIWTDVAPAPPWLIETLKPTPNGMRIPFEPWQFGTRIPNQDGSTAYGRAALEREAGTLALAVDGTRNDTLVKAAFRCGQLVGGDQLDPADVVNALLVVALRIGLGESEALATIRSGVEAGLRSPKGPRVDH